MSHRRRASGSVWLAVTMLVSACGGNLAPTELPSLADYQTESMEREYLVLRSEPAIVEARCLVLDEGVLRNPHFKLTPLDAVSVPPPERWISFVDARFDTDEYVAWVRESSDDPLVRGFFRHSEEQLGQMEWERAYFESRLSYTEMGDEPVVRRRVERYFLTIRLRIDWDGSRADSPVLVQALPLPDVAVHLGFMVQRDGLHVYAHWNRECLPSEPPVRWST